MSFGSGGGSSNLSGDGDVALNSPGDGQVLRYSSSVSKWQNQVAPVTSVNGQTAVVALAASDVGAATQADIDQSISDYDSSSNYLPSVDHSFRPIIRYNTTASKWPLRNTVTGDTTQPVVWECVTVANIADPASGSGYALPGDILDRLES